MKKLSIASEQFPNKDILGFNLNQRISYGLYVSINHTNIEDEPLTPEQKHLLLKILEMDGVMDVGIDQYSITIKKAPMFTWEEIEPMVLKLILNNFPKDVSGHKELINKYNQELKDSFKNLKKESQKE